MKEKEPLIVLPKNARPSKTHPVKESSEHAQNNQNAIIPLNKISNELINKLKNQHIYLLKIPAGTSIGEAANIYFKEYLSLYAKNQHLNDQLIQVITDRNMLAEQYNQIKRNKSNEEEAVRRKRRYARDIERLFHCPIERCNRGYGSEGSLSHHVRLKHIEFYQSGKYEIFIQNYIDDLQKNKKKQENQEQQLLQAEKAEKAKKKIQRRKLNPPELTLGLRKKSKKEAAQVKIQEMEE